MDSNDGARQTLLWMAFHMEQSTNEKAISHVTTLWTSVRVVTIYSVQEGSVQFFSLHWFLFDQIADKCHTIYIAGFLAWTETHPREAKVLKFHPGSWSVIPFVIRWSPCPLWSSDRALQGSPSYYIINLWWCPQLSHFRYVRSPWKWLTPHACPNQVFKQRCKGSNLERKEGCGWVGFTMVVATVLFVLI